MNNKMDLAPNEITPSQDYELYYSRDNPQHSMVLLKNMKHMDYFNQSYYLQDDSGQEVYKYFPNYYVLSNLDVAHPQKKKLHAMLAQLTDPEIMIRVFCKLAKKCYPMTSRISANCNTQYSAEMVQNYQLPNSDCRKFFFFEGLTQPRVQKQSIGIIRWYTDQTFFYYLLNRLLRAGKDSTELYYCQYFVQLLSKAIKLVYLKQKEEKLEQVSGDFTCFRAAYFSQKQIEQLQKNIGNHIETLGFMSTSIKEKVAYNFLFNNNTIVEISVSADALKDEVLDLGYAFLTQEYSPRSSDEKEVLFNVLSSFQIQDVSKFNYKGREIWKIKLKYGVTYQMMKEYKQNKSSTQRGPAQKQLILSILAWQNHFKHYQNQWFLIYQQGIPDEYIWMMKFRISLLKSIPQFEQFGRIQESLLYMNLTQNQIYKQKEQQFIKQTQQSFKSSFGPQKKNQSLQIKHQNLINLQLQIMQQYDKNNFLKAKTYIQQWKENKQQLFADPRFQQYTNDFPQQKIRIQEQMSTQVLVSQVMTNMAIQFQMRNRQKLKLQVEEAEKIKAFLLNKYGKFHFLYGALERALIFYHYQLGSISQKEYLEKEQFLDMISKGMKPKKIKSPSAGATQKSPKENLCQAQLNYKKQENFSKLYIKFTQDKVNFHPQTVRLLSLAWRVHLQHFLGIDSQLYIQNELQIVLNLRMLGRQEQANQLFKQLKQKYPQFLECHMSQFEKTPFGDN